MKILQPFVDAPLRAAVLAALSFVLALLAASVSGLGFDPLQHPVGLLTALPGGEGLAYRFLLYGLPGAMALLVAATAWTALSTRRSGRLALMLAGLAAAGVLAMGLFPLRLQDLSGQGGRLHAAGWLLWLSGWGAALALGGLAAWQAGRRAAAVACLALLAATVGLAGGLLPLPGALAQLLCWAGWLGGQLALAGGRLRA